MSESGQSDRRYFPRFFTWTIVDLTAATVLGVLWYLLFDLVFNSGGVGAGLHMAEYGRSWMTGVIVWGFLLFLIKTKNDPFREIGLSGLPRFGLFLLMGVFLHKVLFFATGAERAMAAPVALVGLHLALGVYCLGIRPRLRPFQGRLFEVAAAMTLLAAGLMITEGILRVAGWGILQFSRANVLVYEDDPDDTRYRILCLGDSHTYGIGAPRGMGYPEQLKGILEEHFGPDRVAVINAGVPGASSGDTRMEFERRWARSWYHTVIVWTGINNTMNLRHAPRHLLAEAGRNRWTLLGHVLSERLSDVRLYRAAVILGVNVASVLAGDDSEEAEDLSFWGIRSALMERTGWWTERLRQIENLDPGQARYTGEQRLAFRYLALPELSPSARYEPLADWVFPPTVAGEWQGRDWCLHGWALICLSEGQQPLARYRAFQAFERALEKDPEDYWAWLGLARSLRDVSRTPVAARLSILLAEKRPDDPVAGIYAIQGRTALDRRHPDEVALEVLEEFLDEDFYKAYYVHTLLEQGKIDEAEEWLTGQEGQAWGQTAEWAWAAGRMGLLQKRMQFCVGRFKQYLERSAMDGQPIDEYVRLLALLAGENAMLVAAKVLPFKEVRQLGEPRLDRWMVDLLSDVLEGEVAVDYGMKARERHTSDDPLFLFTLGKAYVGRSFSEKRARPDDISTAVRLFRLSCEGGIRLRQVYVVLHSVLPKNRLDILFRQWREDLNDPWREELMLDHLDLEDLRVKVLLYDLEKIHQTVMQDNASMMILNYPFDWRGENPFDAAHRYFSESNRVPLVDIAALMAEQLETLPREALFVPDGHPNLHGYGLVAGEVFRHLTGLEVFRNWARRNPGKPGPVAAPEEVEAATVEVSDAFSAEAWIGAPTGGISATESLFELGDET